MTTTRDRVAARVCTEARNGIAKSSQTGYTQTVRRWNGIRYRVHYPRVPDEGDCSAWVTWLIWDARIAVRGAAGADVMNDAGWAYGNTDTLIKQGARHRGHIPGNWHPGRTLLFYGGPSNGSDPHHVTVWLGNGYEGSHGRWQGPELRKHGPSYRTDFVQARAYPV